MILAITSRFNQVDNKEYLSCNKEYIDTLNGLDIALIPVISLVEIEKIANLCDGLIVAGRDIDINPKYYGENPIKETNLLLNDDIDDNLDFELIKVFNEKNKPILGICAGMQVINVFFGGSLYQNILNHKDENTMKMHDIKIEKDSLLYKCYSDTKVNVNSYHHQSIKKVANNFKVTAISLDGIIEAIEYKNILGVQWHPEKMNNKEFFKKYVEEYFNNKNI